MKKDQLRLAIISAFSISTSPLYALTINWVDGPGAGNTKPFSIGAGLTTSSAINATPFTVMPGFPPQFASEFRMIDPNGNVGGGGEKTAFDGVGDESWSFDSNGLMTGTGTAFPGNAGAFAGAAPTANTNPTLDRGTFFKGALFTFLAPTTTSLAGAAHGTSSLSFTRGDNFSIFFPVLEFQWGGSYFPLGINSGGVAFDCIGALAGNVHCAAEYTFDALAGDDPGAAGFDGWTAQWNYFGTMTPHVPQVPLPPAIWLFATGIIGLTGLAKRK